MDFNSPADVAAMFNSASSSSGSSDTDKLDPSAVNYCQDLEDYEAEDFEVIDIEESSKRSSSRKFLYPENQLVEELRPDEIRWFYKTETSKKWMPFIGYDSLRLECRHRALDLNTGEDDDDIDKDEKILVRGGLYEVDVKLRKCSPVYWSEDDLEIMRGLWFEEGVWQPLEESCALKIEWHHMEHFKGMKLESVSPDTKGQKPVIHNVVFKNFHVDWNATDEVYKFYDTASSKLFRNVRQSLGWQKSGTRLRRGYVLEAVMDDKPPDICHLVFVIHGIGQMMDTGSIAKVTKDVRDRVKHLRAKMFPEFDRESHRAEFLPVQWRSTLRLDQGTVESVTPNKMKGVRTMLNSSALDILYYTSPLYRYEILSTLKKELIRLYQMFCARHPYFEASNGKVSIIAHSLGSVICFDIITGWSPVNQCHQWMNALLKEQEEMADDMKHTSDEMLEYIHDAKSKVSSLDSVMNDIQERQGTDKNLPFSIENMFCLGSPLAVFLALRGVRPENVGSQDHILSKNLCKRLFNIFHPSDTVAYRLEPLILKHYSTIMPLQIHHFTAPKKLSYSKIPRKAYAAFTGAIDDKKKETDSSESDTTAKEETADLSLSNSQKLYNWFNSKKKKSSEGKLSAELQTMHKARSSPDQRGSPEAKQYTDEEAFDKTELEWRLDFQLKEQRLENSYLSVITSHTSYWTNKDLAYFLLIHLHPEMQGANI